MEPALNKEIIRGTQEIAASCVIFILLSTLSLCKCVMETELSDVSSLSRSLHSLSLALWDVSWGLVLLGCLLSGCTM